MVVESDDRLKEEVQKIYDAGYRAGLTAACVVAGNLGEQAEHQDLSGGYTAKLIVKELQQMGLTASREGVK